MANLRHKMLLDKAAKIILRDCMNLKENESCLTVTDSRLKPIGNILYENSLKIAKKSELILTAIPKAHGAEPPKKVADEMLKYDVILMPTTKSLSHTKARENSTKKGARIASMPGITEAMMTRALSADFYRIRKINKKLISRLKNKDSMKITTKKGTDIKLCIKGRKWLSDDGLYARKGTFGNLPAGEVFIAPLENKTNGTIVVDVGVGGLGKVDKNIKIIVKDGFIIDVNGGKVANQFKNLLKNELYKNVAELGIGTNYKAKITGNILEDEKAAGTCHIAFGNNKHFGGKNDVPFHVDVVIRNPTIYADGALLVKDGKIKQQIQKLLY